MSIIQNATREHAIKLLYTFDVYFHTGCGAHFIGIQLADALASLIRYYHDNPQEKDAKKWFSKLKKEKKLAFELLVNQ